MDKLSFQSSISQVVVQPCHGRTINKILRAAPYQVFEHTELTDMEIPQQVVPICYQMQILLKTATFILPGRKTN